MENNQRRSARIMLSIPVTVRGRDQEGNPFETAGRTVTLNRHGACIQLARALKPGQTVRVINQANKEEAEFRVVGPVAPPRNDVGEWGIECLRVDKNIWDIEFPPTSEDSDAHILLSCRRCQSLGLQSLSLVEVEVLETAGLLTKACAHCGDSTPWGYPQRAFEVETQTYQAAVSQATSGFLPLTVDRRKSQRRPAQLPVRVRDYYGETEIAQTENTSPDGFCFSSPRKYLVGQGIMVVCSFDAAKEKPEVRARIVRAEEVPGRERCLYGARFEPAPH